MTHAVKTYNAPTSERRRYVSELETEQRQAFMRQKFMQQSRFHKAFGVDVLEIDCSPYAQVMRSEVIRILGMKGVDVPGGKLEELHLHLSADHKRYGFDDGVNKISALLYDTDNAFEAQYMRLLSECVRQHFKYPFYFQATPTIRIHCPDAENSHHYPRYHTDINYGHPVEEINIWIPLTMPIAPQQHGFRMMSLAHSRNTLDAFGYSFTPFIEYAINDAGFNRKLNDISPQVSTPLGKMLCFDSRCIHTAEPMKAHTRVSMDIRILPVEDFNSSEVLYQGVGRKKIHYLPGEAYHSKCSTEL